MTAFQKILPGMMLGCLVVLSACSGDAGSGKQGDPLANKAGQEVFLNHCMGCHMGAGDPPGPNGVILSSSKMSSEGAFKDYIRHPDNGAMPSINPSDVSDADVKKLYDYLKSVH